MKTATLELFMRTIEALDAKVSALEARASASPKLPTPEAIVAAALEATGHAVAWTAGTLEAKLRLEVLAQVRIEARAWFRSEAQAVLDSLGEKSLLGSAKAKVAEFFSRARKYLREMAVAGVLAFAGPGDIRRNEAMLQELDAQVEIQREHLDKFEVRIISEARPLDGNFVAVAEQYGSASWGIAQNTVRAGTRAAGRMKFERRVHRGKAVSGDPCGPCRKLERAGWQPIGTLPPIGAETPCGDKCHCDFEYCEFIGGPRYFEDLGAYYKLPEPEDIEGGEKWVWDPIHKCYAPEFGDERANEA